MSERLQELIQDWLEGANNFPAVLSEALDSRFFTAAELVEKLPTTLADIHRWQHGRDPQCPESMQSALVSLILTPGPRPD